MAGLATLSNGRPILVGRSMNAPFSVWWRGEEVGSYGADEDAAEAHYVELLVKHRALLGNPPAVRMGH